MIETRAERRALARARRAGEIVVLVDDRSFPAELTDISVAGLQVRLDAMTFDEIRERIDAVRFGDGPPLPIALVWGIFDGRFGAVFRDRQLATPEVERYIASRQEPLDETGA